MKTPNLFPLAMKIAAQTIGLDLVAVKPTPGPKIDLLYIDFQYDDVDASTNERPQVFKLSSFTNSTEIKAQLALAAVAADCVLAALAGDVLCCC